MFKLISLTPYFLNCLFGVFTSEVFLSQQYNMDYLFYCFTVIIYTHQCKVLFALVCLTTTLSCFNHINFLLFT